MDSRGEIRAIDSRLLWFVLCIVAGFSFYQTTNQHPWAPIIWPEKFTSHQTEPVYQEFLIPNGGQNSTHSASVTTLPSGDMIAMWFAGTREGHKDVRIFKSVFHQSSLSWDAPSAVLDTPYVAQHLGRYIGKLGNPLVFVDSRRRMWMFFVSVSYGGWAGSSLNVIWSEDLGNSWTAPKRLITSPFINISTLVRNHLYELEDGSLILPVYHEFVAQFPELLRISPEGEVIRKIRMAGSGAGIQPVLFEGEQNEVRALMRSGSHTKDWRVLSLRSENEGKSWLDFEITKLPNPNSAQVAAKVSDKLWLWVGNHNEKHRQDMTLAVSQDLNVDWSVIHQFENGGKGDRFSYPTIIQDELGMWNLLYTYNRKNIKHVRFNQAWLNQQMKQQGQKQGKVQ